MHARPVIIGLLGLLLIHPPAGAGEPIGVAVLEFDSKGGISQEKMDALGDLVAQRIQQTGAFRVIGKSDIGTLLTMEEQRQKLSECTDSSCLAEIGGALGVQFLVAGNVSAFGQKYLLNLKLIDVGRIVVASRITKTVEGDEGLLAAVPEAVDDLLEQAEQLQQARADAGAPARRTSGHVALGYELTINACLGGSEVHGYQGTINPQGTDESWADMGVHRWGVGGRFGLRLDDLHTIFAHVDWLWEEWQGRLSAGGSSSDWNSNINLLRVLAGYRFAWPVLSWLAPYAELGLGGHVYFPIQANLSGATSDTVTIEPDSRFALMLGLGLRFDLGELGLVSAGWLYDVPVAGYSSGSFVLSGGIAF